jgi:hypothetical protein
VQLFQFAWRQRPGVVAIVPSGREANARGNAFDHDVDAVDSAELHERALQVDRNGAPLRRFGQGDAIPWHHRGNRRRRGRFEWQGHSAQSVDCSPTTNAPAKKSREFS